MNPLHVVEQAHAVLQPIAPHASLPLHVTEHFPGPHFTFPLHVADPLHVTVVDEAAPESMVLPQASAMEHCTSHVPLPHVIAPLHD